MEYDLISHIGISFSISVLCSFVDIQFLYYINLEFEPSQIKHFNN